MQRDAPRLRRGDRTGGARVGPESCYGTTKAEIVAVLQRILRTKQLVVQDAETIWKAVRSFEASRADFADCLIERTGAAHECESTSTFDKHAASTGMRLIY